MFNMKFSGDGSFNSGFSSDNVSSKTNFDGYEYLQEDLTKELGEQHNLLQEMVALLLDSDAILSNSSGSTVFKNLKTCSELGLTEEVLIDNE